jgi:hypothetical protein
LCAHLSTSVPGHLADRLRRSIVRHDNRSALLLVQVDPVHAASPDLAPASVAASSEAVITREHEPADLCAALVRSLSFSPTSILRHDGHMVRALGLYRGEPALFISWVGLVPSPLVSARAPSGNPRALAERYCASTLSGSAATVRACGRPRLTSTSASSVAFSRVRAARRGSGRRRAQGAEERSSGPAGRRRKPAAQAQRGRAQPLARSPMRRSPHRVEAGEPSCALIDEAQRLSLCAGRTGQVPSASGPQDGGACRGVCCVRQSKLKS